MNRGAAPVAIGPGADAAWHASLLGAMTETIEQRLIFGLMGELSGARLLDVGCGDGSLVCSAAERGATAYGADTDPAMLAAASARVERAEVGATCLEEGCESRPFGDAEFAVVVAVTILCFVADARAAVRERVRVLRLDGGAVSGELGCWSLRAAWRGVRGWFGSGTSAAAGFRTAAELRALAAQAGLGAVTVRGAVLYPPIALLAGAMAPFDPRLGRIATFGAACIALSAIKGNGP